MNIPVRTHAQISRSAIQKLYISMRHLFIRGSYKPLGVSGEAMITAMLSLKPEIYGFIADEEKVELDGLLYIFQRLPKGIEQCRYINLISREGFDKAGFPAIVPPRRKRDCYRVDAEQMFIEMTRGGSDIYDILTHLTFMYIEAEKIRKNCLDGKGRKSRAWIMLEKMIEEIQQGHEINESLALTYLNTILGRTYDEVAKAHQRFKASKEVNSLFEIAYWLGKLSMEEHLHQIDREITFSPALREQLGHHIYGERWATNIKSTLQDHGLLHRPIHIISANLHSVMNCLFAMPALEEEYPDTPLDQLAEILSQSTNEHLRNKVEDFAHDHGMISLFDTSGTNIGVQIFDLEKIPSSFYEKELGTLCKDVSLPPVIIVMDYAFGEQAYETMDELLKPYHGADGKKTKLNISSVNIMGKAGILQGEKGDLMIPTAHVFEGTADNYPLENDLTAAMFEGNGLGVYEGPMITVLGTSLQNRDILAYFMNSSWGAIGLEMEGAHYQKAIQAASKIRNSVNPNLKVRYAYYASDNPLETGSTLASGSLGLDGVKPTYLITIEMLKGCLKQSC